MRLRGVVLIAAALTVSPPVAAAPGPLRRAGGSCVVTDLPGLASLYSRARRATRAAGAAPGEVGLDAAVAADFWQVARAVVGPTVDDRATTTVVVPDADDGGPSRLAVPCDGHVRSRDGVAWRLGLAGYTAREIADVIAGHLTPADLDEARARLMAGLPDESVAAFLDARWRPGWSAVASSAPSAGPASPARRPTALVALEADLTALARQHRVPVALVRAVMAAESAGNARALSPAGAIGLMQLMPGTAASLGVDPWEPRQNLRGGITYLGRLLRAFDEDARLALIAYNAGPQHAREVRAGRAVAYRETRQYLAAIGARYPLR